MKPLYLIRYRWKGKEENEVSFVRGHAALVSEIDRLKAGYYTTDAVEGLEVFELNRHTMQTLKVPEPQVVFRA